MCHLPEYLPLDWMWSVSDLSALSGLEGLFQDIAKTQVQGGKKQTVNWNVMKSVLSTQTVLQIKTTHRNVICCGTRCGFCCTSADSHRSVPCMSKGDEVACPRWPKKPLYIRNQHQGCELDPCQPNIPPFWVHCHCTLLLRSSSIWFGMFSTCFCSKRVNKFTYWDVCGTLGKCAAWHLHMCQPIKVSRTTVQVLMPTVGIMNI